MLLDPLLVLAVAFGASVLAVYLLRAGAHRRSESPGVVPVGEPPADGPAIPTRSRHPLRVAMTLQEATTIAMTMLATLVLQPPLLWAYQSMHAERSTTGRPHMILFYALAALAPGLLGGWCGWRYGQRRGDPAIRLWRSTATGLVAGELLVLALLLAVSAVVVFALASSVLLI